MMHVDDGINRQQQEKKAAQLQTHHGTRSAAAGTAEQSRAGYFPLVRVDYSSCTSIIVLKTELIPKKKTHTAVRGG